MDRDGISDSSSESPDENQENIPVAISENTPAYYKIPFNVRPPIPYMGRDQGDRFCGPSFTDRPIEEQIRLSQLSEELRNENRDSHSSYDASRWRVGLTTIVPSNMIETTIVEDESMNVIGEASELGLLEPESTSGCSSIETAIQERNAIETSILGCASNDGNEGRAYAESAFERNLPESNILEGNPNEPPKIERISSIPCNIGGRRNLRPRRAVLTPYTRNSASVEHRNAMRPRGAPGIAEQQPKNEAYEEKKCDPKD